MAPADSHGILLLDKPVGESSFQALYPVKRAFGGKKGAKIGHAGTLDPAASGLLVIGVGAGTRLLEFLEAMPKSYRFRMNLGVTTDTYDLEGEVLERRDASAITRADIEALLGKFLGPISQIPPDYSAIKIGGKRACDRVRDGETVTLAARQVRIDRIEILSFDAASPTGTTAILEMDCSKGTYVRSLVHDLGQLLGCGAAADQIRRLAIGPFRVEDAVAPADIGPAALLPLERAVRHLPALRLKDASLAGLMNGNSIPATGYSAMAPDVNLNPDSNADAGPDDEVMHAVFSEQGALLAMATVNAIGHLCPRKVFPIVPPAGTATADSSAASATA